MELSAYITKLFGKDYNNDGVNYIKLIFKITELFLDGKYKKTEIEKQDQELLEKFKNLKKLCLNACKLKSLANLPNLTSITTLELSDNKITDNELDNILRYPNLKKLKLSGNYIKKKLKSLELYECEVSKKKDYKKEIFTILPQLETIDNTTKEGKVVESEDDESDYNEEEEDEENEKDDFVDDDGLEGEDEEVDEEAGEEEDGEEEEEDDEEDEEGDKETKGNDKDYIENEENKPNKKKKTG